MCIENDLPPAPPEEIDNLEYWLDLYTREGARPKPARLQTLGHKVLAAFQNLDFSYACYPIPMAYYTPAVMVRREQ